MTQNIRCIDPSTPPGHPDHWPARRPVLEDLLRTCGADVIGTQEVLPEQIAAVADALPGWVLLGTGRKADGTGEHTLLCIRSARLDVLDHEQFWLSDTPQVRGSQSWGSLCPRIAVRAHLRDRVTGVHLQVAVTHLDHGPEEARTAGARLLAQRLSDGGLGLAAGTPTVLLGDMNTAAGTSEAFTVLTAAGFADAEAVAEHRAGPGIGTFIAYGQPVPGGERIDWVLVRGLAVSTVATHEHRLGDARASDHAAVQADLRIEPV